MFVLLTAFALAVACAVVVHTRRSTAAATELRERLEAKRLTRAAAGPREDATPLASGDAPASPLLVRPDLRPPPSAPTPVPSPPPVNAPAPAPAASEASAALPTAPPAPVAAEEPVAARAVCSDDAVWDRIFAILRGEVPLDTAPGAEESVPVLAPVPTPRATRARRCGHCRESGHDRRRCPQLVASTVAVPTRDAARAS